MAVDPHPRPMRAAVKYNPHLWSDDELRDVFVVRQTRLNDLLDRVRSTPAEIVPQATLLVGARGMGKTTLLRRLALAVREDPALASRWLPLTFPEEQYTVSSLAELWRNVLDALIDALEQSGASKSEVAELDRRAHELTQVGREEQAASALSLITTWCDTHQKRLLLLIDSTDLLLEGLRRASSAPARKAKPGRGSAAARNKDDTALWQLRKVLLQTRCLMWIGATYQSLESHYAYADAFHDFFDLIELSPLSLNDMQEALVALARRFGMRGITDPAEAEAAMRGELSARPERLRALRTLTGGNPRTTAILYELFAAGADGDLHGDLRALLDLMTPLYKSRMEQLAEQPRKILAHVMEAWDPVSARDLAQASGIAVTTVSAQLVRLEHEGLVQKVPLAGVARSGFQVTERFFNIWFLMRHAARRLRQRLTWLIEFMRLWYRGEELQEIALHRASWHQRRAVLSPEQAEFSRALARTMPVGQLARERLDYAVCRQARDRAEALQQRIGDVYPDLFDLQGDDRAYLSGDACHKRFVQVQQALAAIPADDDADRDRWVRRVLGSLDASLAEKLALARSTPRLTRALAQRPWPFPHRDLRRRLIAAAFAAEARETVSALLSSGDLLPDCADLDFFRKQLAGTLPAHSAAADLALTLFVGCSGGTGAASLVAELAQQWAGQPDRARLLALAAIDTDLAAARRLADAACAQEAVATALSHLVAGLTWSYPPVDAERAEAAYRQAIALDENFAAPWFGLGHLLHNHLKRYDEAEAAYRQAIALDATNAWPWYNLGILYLDRLQRCAEAEAAFLVAQKLAPEEPVIWTNHARLLAGLGRKEEADAGFRRAVELLGTYPPEGEAGDPQLRLQAHLWLNNRDLAQTALQDLAARAEGGDAASFSRLRAQVSECHRMGIGQRLADLMQASPLADFLAPFALALSAAGAGSMEALDGASAEIRVLASEVLRELESKG